MNLLAVDTSTTSCSVALLEGRRLQAETVYTRGKTHSRNLLSMIHRILTRCQCDAGAIDAMAVSRGPGTFTGLRIGLSTVKGLAVATGAQVVGINSLAALAFPLRLSDRPVVAMIDARRGEVYHAQWCGDRVPVEVGLSTPQRAAEALPEGAILVGSGAVLYREVFATRCPRVRFADPMQHVIRAASVGLLAEKRLRQGDVDSIVSLVPDYIRKSDAQIQIAGSC